MPVTREPQNHTNTFTQTQTFNAKTVQDYTETDILTARPVAAHQGFVATPGSVPGIPVDYHGNDIVASCASSLNLPSVGLYPLESEALHSGSGSFGPAVAGYFRSDNTGAGAVSALRCLRVRATNTGGGTATAVEGLKVNGPDNTGSTITNLYGVYVDDQTAAAGTVTNTAYTFYGAGGLLFNTGAVGVGPGATSPAAMVHIRPALAADVAFKVQSHATQSGHLLDFVNNANDTTLAAVDKDGNLGVGIATPLAKVHLKGASSAADTLFIEASGSGAKSVVMRADGAVGLGLNYPTQALNAVRLQLEFNGAGIQRNMSLTNNHATANGDGVQIEGSVAGNIWGKIQNVVDATSGAPGSSWRFIVRDNSFVLTERFRVDGNGVGFNGATPVAKPTLAVAATDLATVITLANDLRTRLIAYGLGA